MTLTRAIVGFGVAVSSTVAAAQTDIEPRTPGEALVFEVLFDRCLESVQSGQAPYSASQRDGLGDTDPARVYQYSPVNFAHYLVLDGQFVAQHGSVPHGDGGTVQICTLSQLRDPGQPRPPGVDVAEDFMTQLNARAMSEGFSAPYDSTGDATPLGTYIWVSETTPDLSLQVFGDLTAGQPQILVMSVQLRLPD